MDNMLKTLIIITLIYYLIKGLIYLMFWQTTVRIEEKAKEKKRREKEKEKLADEIWETERDREKD
ncbi:hypothetical protein [Syntrophomonas erecta]